MTLRWSGSPLEDCIYLLCLGTSALCAWLLWRAYRRSRAKLLIWSSLFFWLMALNNLVLAVDILLLPENDLTLIRIFTALLAISALLFGLVWEV
jgi:hypothetical protein